MMVVVLVADSLRGDTPGFTGGPARTPTMDALAAEGTVFPRAFASGSWTIPSMLSMVTGVYPHRLGVCRWRHPFPVRQPTLMSAFAAAGFDVRTLVWNPRWAFANGTERGLAGDSQVPAEVVDALRGPRGRDRLVLIHHWWTHLPYLNRKLPLSGWLRACGAALEVLNKDPQAMAPKFRALYLETIRYFSEELLERYLDAASAGGEDVLLVLTGDHGENWGEALPPGRRIEHVYDLHGRWLRDETVHVPLVYWGKRHGGSIPAGQRLDGFARGVDLAPTVAELAGIPWPGPLPSPGPKGIERGIDRDGENLAFDGRSLARAIRDSQALDAAQAMTVSSHNAHEPHVYPPEARHLWRGFGMRTPAGWHTWDGAHEAAEQVPVPGRDDPCREEHAEVTEGLVEEWHRSVGAGPLLPKGMFPATSDQDEPDDDGDRPGLRAEPEPAAGDGDRDRVLRQMRMLGYLD